jgi:hypothetical protein
MTDIGMKKAQMDTSTLHRLMMQARQVRSDTIYFGAVVLFHKIARGAAFRAASLRSVFAMPRSSRAGLLVPFAPISNSVSKGGVQ